MTTVVFVDESGDAGMKLDKGSSEFFVVTAVLFEDVAEAQRCDDSFAELRRQLGFPELKEFHFHGEREQTRRAFLTHVNQFDFSFVAVVLNKRKLTSPGFQFKESAIKYTTRLVVENLKPNLVNAIVVVDGSGAKEFRQSFANYLKRQVNSPEQRHVKKVKMANSVTNNLVQLADMVCGAVSHSIKHGDYSYRKLIGAKQLRAQVWPQ